MAAIHLINNTDVCVC